MPFGIPSEDFHGGFGIPHDDVGDNEGAVTVKSETKEEVYERVILDLNNILIMLDDQGCLLDEDLCAWREAMKKFREVKGLE